MKNLGKMILVGIITTMSRIIGQFLIPAGEQSVLAPSIFAVQGTMPLAFTIYGIFAYTFIASLFLLIRKQMTGNRLWQGLKYGIACCVVWIVYLLEPLPHVAPLDRITYPLIDSVALLVMGLMLGFLFGETRPLITKKRIVSYLPLIFITVCFLAGRLIQYVLFDIYSSFEERTMETIVWCLLTGIAVSLVLLWLNLYVDQKSRVIRALILGGLLFGLDLTLFNFFMPLVFDANIPDLILRTVMDISAVTIGSLSFGSHSLNQQAGGF